MYLGNALLATSQRPHGAGPHVYGSSVQDFRAAIKAFVHSRWDVLHGVL